MRIAFVILFFGIGCLLNFLPKKNTTTTTYSPVYWKDTIVLPPRDTMRYGYGIPSKGVILLTFNGYVSKQEVFGLKTLSSALLMDSTRATIQRRVGEFYDPWDVVVTQDDSLFYTFPQNRRVRVVVTRSAALLREGPVVFSPGGLSRYNSLFLRDTTPSMVSTSIIGEESAYVATVVAHEIAHCLGLAHQALFYNGVIQSYYDPGTSDSIPIMGGGGKDKVRYWKKGVNSFSQEQNDTAWISRTWKRVR